MKTLKNIISTTLWVLLGLTLLLMILLETPAVQDYIGTRTAKALERELGTRVDVGKVRVSLPARLTADDVVVYDKADKEMMRTKRLSASIELMPLADGRISISSAQIFGATFCLYQPSADQPTNFQFFIDALASKDTTQSSSTNLHIGSLIIRRSNVTFDRLDAPKTQTFNPAHLDIRDISGHFRLRTLTADSINAEVKKLSFAEQTGLTMSRLAMKLSSGRSTTQLSEFCLKLPNTEINIDSIRAIHRTTADNSNASPTLFNIDLATIRIEGGIDKSYLTPADFAFLMPGLASEKGSLSLSAMFESTDDRIILRNLGLASNDNKALQIDIDGWIRRWYDSPEWHINLNELGASKETIMFLASLNTNDTTTTASKIVRRMGSVDAQGTLSSHDGRAIHADIKANSEIGGLTAAFNFAEDNSFAGSIDVEELFVGHLLADNRFGTATALLRMSGTLPYESNIDDATAMIESDEGRLTATVEGTVSEFEYNGYKFANINLSGAYSADEAHGRVLLTDPNAAIDVEGKLVRMGNTSKINVMAKVDNLSPSLIKMSDRWGDARFNGTIDADFTANDINDARGRLSVSNLSMTSHDRSYSLKRMDVLSGYDDSDKHFLLITGDFGTARIVGDFDYNTISHSLVNAVRRKIPTLPGLPTTIAQPDNSFYVSAAIEKTDWLDHLLGIPFNIHDHTTLYAKVDDANNELMTTLDIPIFTYEDTEYHNTFLSISQPHDTLHCDIRTEKINANGTRTALHAQGDAADNRLSTVFEWGNTSNPEAFGGQINASSQFYSDDRGRQTAQIYFHPSSMIVNDAVWNIKPSNVTYSDKNLTVNDFDISHGTQRIAINGTASASASDSIHISIRDIDVKYIVGVTRLRNITFGGDATGSFHIKTPFTDPTASGKLMVNRFTFQEGSMGTLDANVSWNKQEQQIDIDAVADNGPRSMTYINGYISPIRQDIELGIKADGTSIAFLQQFAKSFAQDVSGNTHGTARVAGPLNAINLYGDMVVNGEMLIKPLGCKYYLRNDSVRMTHNEIELRNMPIYDIYNNIGHVNGAIHHINLAKLSYDLDIELNRLLFYDFKEFGESTFHGTVFATGDVGLHGKSGILTMDVNVTPEAGSSFTYNASDQNSITNREFIHWNDATRGNRSTQIIGGNIQANVGNTQTNGSNTAESRLRKTVLPKNANTSVTNTRKIGSDLYLNFIINTTPDFTLRLLMNSATDDYISLNGSGVLKASFHNKGAFNMFGTYRVDHGTYEMTIQDILKKNFSFNEGGTIVFGGDPFYSTLNLQATHTVNGVSLADLNVGNTYKNNSTRVNCLMNIGGQPLQPEVTFDIDLPTASNDERQMIRSILNSEDEMNQQVVYLLGIGRFYPQSNNNAETQNGNQQSQTSLAMQSLLSATLSGQINNMLNNVIKSNNWSFGANISTGNSGWDNAEYEGLLSGRLLNNRLLINGQFGYRDNVSTDNTSFIGDFDVRYMLLPNGNLAARIYNQTNDRYFTKSSLNTQGIGLIMKKDFTTLYDLFGIKKRKKTREIVK